MGSQIAEGSAVSEVPSVLATGRDLVGLGGGSLPGKMMAFNRLDKIDVFV